MKHLYKILAVLAMSASLEAGAMILPPNNLNMFDNPGRISNITEQQFNEIVDHIVEVYKPLAKLHGAELVAIKAWKDSTVNAYATQKGNVWEIHMFGGLARRDEVTPDGFAMVVCHELGHHFGGYYFYGDREWASAEGQADYFATQSCGRRIFNRAPKNFRLALGQSQVNPIVKEKCAKAWGSDGNALGLCYRLSDAGYHLALLLGKLGGGEPKFETPDQSKVNRTNTAHPRAQCRLDTYFAGALCRVNFDPKVIPGKGHQKGNNSIEAEGVAHQYACTPKNTPTLLGIKPACWFKHQSAFQF